MNDLSPKIGFYADPFLHAMVACHQRIVAAAIARGFPGALMSFQYPEVSYDPKNPIRMSGHLEVTTGVSGQRLYTFPRAELTDENPLRVIEDKCIAWLDAQPNPRDARIKAVMETISKAAAEAAAVGIEYGFVADALAENYPEPIEAEPYSLLYENAEDLIPGEPDASTHLEPEDLVVVEQFLAPPEGVTVIPFTPEGVHDLLSEVFGEKADDIRTATLPAAE